jgi:hypothetical protein
MKRIVIEKDAVYCLDEDCMKQKRREKGYQQRNGGNKNQEREDWKQKRN